MVNPSGTEPKKMNAGSGTGIHCESGLGPCFGVKGYYSLKFTGKCQLFDLAAGFQCPANVDFRTFFTGDNLFTISELEVFKVNF